MSNLISPNYQTRLSWVEEGNAHIFLSISEELTAKKKKELTEKGIEVVEYKTKR